MFTGCSGGGEEAPKDNASQKAIEEGIEKEAAGNLEETEKADQVEEKTEGESEEDKAIKFQADDSLKEFINKDAVYDKMASDPASENRPELKYADDKIAVLADYSGMLIYDIESGKLIQGIDNKAIGLDSSQAEANKSFEVRGDSDYIMLIETPAGDSTISGYVYSLKDDALMRADDNLKDMLSGNKLPSQEQEDKINYHEIAESNNGIEPGIGMGDKKITVYAYSGEKDQPLDKGVFKVFDVESGELINEFNSAK